jgi:acyl-CoA synthetase (AMP-forming)/AMP-acid ligase II
VLIFVPMSIPLYEVLLAVLHLGAVAVFVDAWADRRRLEAAVRRTQPHVFAGSRKAHLLRLLNPVVRAIPVSTVEGRTATGWYGSEIPSVEPVEASAPALITFTTGSTGAPKAAMRTHGFLWSQHLALAEHLGLRETDIDMPTLPVFVLNNLALGVTTVLPDFDPRRPGDIDAERIHAQVLRERVTTSSGSPAFYDRLTSWCAAHGKRLPLHAVFTGGAPVLPPLARALRELVARVHVVYGSTEAEPIAGIRARDMLAAMDEAGAGGTCVGREVRSIEAKLVRPHDGPIELGPGAWSDWEVGAGEIGELVVTGAHVLTGYLDDPDAERANKIRDGERVWHRTGDGARRDGEGRLWLMGRVKQRVIRAGATWWPGPVEVRAMEIAGVRHAAYLGMPDPALGHRALLCVECAGGKLPPGTEAQLRVAAAPAPIDGLRALARIPRDPRHASKTDVEALRRELH